MLARTRKRASRRSRSLAFSPIPTISLTPSTSWNSFEQFRTAGANTLATITAGTVGTLQTKTGQYRILNENDFQQLVGLATDVERLQLSAKVRVRQPKKFADSIDFEIFLGENDIPADDFQSKTVTKLLISQGFDAVEIGGNRILVIIFDRRQIAIYEVTEL